MLSNMSTPILGLVDTFVLGHLGQAYYLSAIALSNTATHLIFWSFGFLRMGTTALAAQAVGKQSSGQEILVQSLAVALCLGVGVVLLSPLLSLVCVNLIGGSDLVQSHAEDFLAVRFLAAPAVFVNYVLIGWFIGRQDTKTPLLMLIFANTVNGILDILLVNYTPLGAIGVVWASLIAEYSSLILAVLIIKYRNHLSITHIKEHLIQWHAYLKLFQVNRYLFVRTLAMLGAMSLFTAIGLRHGDQIGAANAILINFLYIMSNGLDGFAHAAEALVGEAWGAKNRQRVREVILACLRWSLVTAVLFSSLFFFMGEFIISLLTDQAELSVIAISYLPWIAMLPMVAVWSYLLDGVFIGAGLLKEMQSAMLMSAGLFLPLALLSQDFGNTGLWLSFYIFTACRAITMFYFYQQAMKKPMNLLL